jgi:hypothetical protein
MMMNYLTFLIMCLAVFVAVILIILIIVEKFNQDERDYKKWYAEQMQILRRDMPSQKYNDHHANNYAGYSVAPKKQEKTPIVVDRADSERGGNVDLQA